MRAIAELIQAHPFLSGLSPDAVGTIAGCGRNMLFRAGEYLFREDQPADRFYLLRAGRVSLETFVPGRGAVAFSTLTDGGIVGLSWLVAPYRARFDARAVDTVRAVAFDAACLRGKCDADPALGYALMQRFMPAMVERLWTARLQALDLYAKPAERQSA